MKDIRLKDFPAEKYIQTLGTLYASSYDDSFDFEHIWTMTPERRMEAMVYIAYMNGMIADLNSEQIERGRDALIEHHAFYLDEVLGQSELEKIGWRDGIDEWGRKTSVHRDDESFFDDVKEKLGEDIRYKFITNRNVKCITKEDLRERTSERLERICRYPEQVDFTPEAHAEVINKIITDELSDTSIKYYLSNFEISADQTNLDKAVKYVMDKADVCGVISDGDKKKKQDLHQKLTKYAEEICRLRRWRCGGTNS